QLPADLEAELATGAAGAVLIPREAGERTPALLASARAVAPGPLLAIVDLQAVTPLPQPARLAATGAEAPLEGAGAAAMAAVRAGGGDVLRFELSALNGESPLGMLRSESERIGDGVAAFAGGAAGAGAVAVAALRAEAEGSPLLRWDRARLDG